MARKAKVRNIDPASVLMPEVAARFTIRRGLPSEFVCAEFGRVNLPEINLRMAERLARKGYLHRLNVDQADPLE